MSLVKLKLSRILALVLCAGACGGQEETPPAPQCIPGETRLCVGPGGCEGAQACLPDGEGLSPCDCGANPPAGAEPATACTAADPSCVVPNRLAAPCEADADCGYGFLCWSPGARGFYGFESGPAGGYCTLPCTQPGDCAHFDAGAACNIADGMEQGLCLRSCLSKDPEPLERKCLDRTDVACWSLAVLGRQPFSVTSRQQGACQPACGSDAECSGRYCDLLSGLCTDEPRDGAPIGAGCGVNDDCASGLCESPIGGASFCSAPCVFGTSGCGFAESAPSREAVCAAPFLAEGGVSEGVGDVGSCLEVCDETNACALADWSCTLGGGLPGARGVCQFIGSDMAFGEADANGGGTP